MALNVPQVLLGCCISNVCVLEVRKLQDLATLRGAGSTTIFLARKDDSETLKLLAKFTTSKESFGDSFFRLHINVQELQDSLCKEIIDRHDELMKGRNGPTDFRIGDIVQAKNGPGERLKISDWPVSVGLRSIEVYKQGGYLCGLCYRGGKWIPWSYQLLPSLYWRVE